MENPYAPPPRDAERRPTGDARPGPGPGGPGPDAHGPGETGPGGPGPGAPGPGGEPGRPSGGRQRPGRTPRAPRPPLPDIDPETLRTVRRRIGTFLLLVIASLLTSQLRLPWQLGGLAFALAAFGTGVWTLVAARRPGLRERLAPMLVVGLVFTVMLALSMSSSLVLWSEQMAHQECLDNALTLSTRDACDETYQDAVEQRLEELTNPRRD